MNTVVVEFIKSLAFMKVRGYEAGFSGLGLRVHT